MHMENVNPEVWTMLENMYGQKKSGKSQEKGFEETPSNSKIVLSDNEYGKY